MANGKPKTTAAKSGSSEQGKEKVKNEQKLVVFELDKEEYAVQITDLREIIGLTEVTPIPNAPDFIEGVLNLRGKIVVVIDLEVRFNLTRENSVKPKHIIVTEVNDNNFGVIVDEVEGIISVDNSQIQETPGLVSAKIHAEYLQGVVVLESEEKESKEKKKTKKTDKSRLIILLDLKKLLQEKELMNLSQAAKEFGAKEQKSGSQK